MSNIAHVVVLMLENRSFDNLLGWLYGPGNPPANVIGGKSGDPPFFGLTPGSYWNPSNASFFSGAPPVKVFATEGTTGESPFTVPDTDPSALRNAMERPNDLQRSMVAAMVLKIVTHHVDMALVRNVLATIRTREDAARFVGEL